MPRLARLDACLPLAGSRGIASCHGPGYWKKEDFSEKIRSQRFHRPASATSRKEIGDVHNIIRFFIQACIRLWKCGLRFIRDIFRVTTDSSWPQTALPDRSLSSFGSFSAYSKILRVLRGAVRSSLTRALGLPMLERVWIECRRSANFHLFCWLALQVSCFRDGFIS